AAHRSARLGGLARPPDDHAHPHVGDPAARGLGNHLPRRTSTQDDLRRVPDREGPRRGRAPLPLRGPRAPRPAPVAGARPHSARVHGRREQHDRERAGPRGVRRGHPAPQRPPVRRRRARLRRDRRALGLRAVPVRRARQQHRPPRRRDLRQRRPGRGLLQGVFVAARLHRVPHRLQGHAQGRGSALPLFGPLAGRVARHRARRLRREREARRRAAGQPLAALRSCPTRARSPRGGDPEPVRASDHRGAAARPPAHRRGRPLPVRPGRLRHAGRLSARAQGRGRLPDPAHGGEHGRRGRRADRGPGRAERARRAASPRRGARGGRMTRPAAHRPWIASYGWIAFLGAGALITVLYLFVKPFAGSGPVMNVLGLAPVLAIVAGVRIYRPQARLAWSFVAIGFLLFWLGDLYTYSYPLLLNREVPFPSLGDAAYIAVYPALIAGVVILQRRRNRRGERGSAIDAAILTVGLALPSWVWLIAPYVHDHSLTTMGRLVSVAYAMGNILLLAVAVRLALAGGQRRLSFHLMIASIVCLLATDFVYGLMLLQGTYDHQTWLDVGWIGFYLLWGAAALHPSMAEIDQPAVGSGGVLTRFRLGLLAGASLIAPTIGIVDDLNHGDLDFAVVRAGSIVLFALVVSRMAGLMRQQERSLERERMLSAAGADLVAATSLEQIDEVALSAA